MAQMISPIYDPEEERRRQFELLYGTPAPAAPTIAPQAAPTQQIPDMSPVELEYLDTIRRGPQVKQRGKFTRLAHALQAGSTGWLEGPTKGAALAEHLRLGPQREAERQYKLNVSALEPLVGREDYWRKHGLDTEAAEARARRAMSYEKRTDAEIAGAVESRGIQRTAEENRQAQRRVDNEIKRARLDFEKGKQTREQFLFQKFKDNPGEFRQYYDAMYGRGVKSEEEFQTELSQYRRKLETEGSTRRRFRETPAEVEAKSAAAARGRASVTDANKQAPKMPENIDPYNAARFLNNPAVSDFIVIERDPAKKSVKYRIKNPAELSKDTETRARYNQFLSQIAELYGQDEYEIEEVK